MTGRTPEKGDVVWISLSPQAGREQLGRRPAVVLSPAVYNARSGLAVVCPVTSQVKGYPFEVRIPEGFPVHGVILADHIRSVDWHEREAEYVCRLPDILLTALFDFLDILFDRHG